MATFYLREALTCMIEGTGPLELELGLNPTHLYHLLV